MNVALKRQASLSTIYEAGVTGGWLAVDGSLGCSWPYVTQTADGDTEPWFLIDLGQTAVIFTIRILNRDACGRSYQIYHLGKFNTNIRVSSFISMLSQLYSFWVS